MRLLALLVISAGLFCVRAQNFAEVRPSPQQLSWQDLEIGVLIHFGPNTFQDREWGDGTAAPSVFNPTQLDAEQWVTAAKAGGAKYLVMVAKHHDGFALYPSRYTDYSVKSSPYKQGKGDVVREVAEACRKHGLKFGVYLSPWDRHEPAYKDNAKYDAYYLNQLTELATRYGPLVEFWLDGAGSEGHVYDFPAYIRRMATYQPNALLFASVDFMPVAGIRWVGNEDGSASEENWNVIQVDGKPQWRPAEADTPLRHGHWFWHPNAEAKLKSLDELLDTYHKTVGRGAQLVLGLAPDNRGLMPEVDVVRLQEFGAAVQKMYGKNLGRSLSLLQGKGSGPYELYATLPDGERIDRVALAEDLTFGQMVRSFRVDAQVGGEWRTVSRGTTIGHKRILVFEPVRATAVRLVMEQTLGEPHVRELGVYLGR